MSLENAREFAKLVMQKESIGKQVFDAIAGKTKPEAAQAVSDLAASAGYEFTLEEGHTVSQEVTPAVPQAGSGPMSEEDLDAVAGGLTTITNFGGAATTYTANGVSQVVSSIGGVAGAPLGAIAGGIVHGIINGDPNNSTATNAAIGAGQGYNNFQSGVVNFFNSIFG